MVDIIIPYSIRGILDSCLSFPVLFKPYLREFPTPGVQLLVGVWSSLSFSALRITLNMLLMDLF